MMPTAMLQERPLSAMVSDEQRKPEHIPVDAYHLLRRLNRAPISLQSLQGVDVEAAADFLVSRRLARRRSVELVITRAGRGVGQVPE